MIKGIFIGAGAIIPGVSSGVICVVLGLYEKLLNSIFYFFKDMKNNTKFIIPIFIGVIIGIIIFGNIIKAVYYIYPVQVSFIFIGLILGSLPLLIKEAESKDSYKIKNFVYLVVALLIGIIMVILEKIVQGKTYNDFNYWQLVLSGFCMSAGVIIPGVSSTVILMLLGVYNAYIYSVSNVFFPILIPMGIGLIIGSIICLIIIKILLDKYYTQTYYAIIGFSIGSIFVLYPGFTFDYSGFNSVLCFLLGWKISRCFNKKNNIKGEKQMKRMVIKNKGITLIALVITIIVLLCVSGIAITSITGENNILNRASEAKNIIKRAELIELVKLDIQNNHIDIIQGKEDKLSEILRKYFSNAATANISNMNEKLIAKDEYGKHKIKIRELFDFYISNIDDEDDTPLLTEPPTTAVYVNTRYYDGNKIAVIPKGFRVSNKSDEQKINTGLVVLDGNDNEWVWILVDDSKDIYTTEGAPFKFSGDIDVTTDFASKGEIVEGKSRVKPGNTSVG